MSVMAASSAIEWTNATGTSDGMRQGVARLRRTATPRRSQSGSVACRSIHTSKASICASGRGLELPLTWRKPRMIFVNSMSDLFTSASPRLIERVFETMQRADWPHIPVLTKRHERLAELASSLPWPRTSGWGEHENRRWTLRADYLREVPLRSLISAEPLLGKLEGLDLTTSTG